MSWLDFIAVPGPWPLSATSGSDRFVLRANPPWSSPMLSMDEISSIHETLDEMRAGVAQLDANGSGSRRAKTQRTAR